DGVWTTDPTKLKEEAIQALFCGRNEVNLGSYSVTTPFLPKDLSKVLPHMSFNLISLNKYWEIVGKDTWNTIQDAFQNSVYDPHILKTLVFLIPKVSHSTFLKELRQINLYNVSYKVSTNVLVSRLMPLLDDIVGPLLSSFILDGVTADNNADEIDPYAEGHKEMLMSSK
ncbi:hypothetical protein Lal_00028156, partial [Lupinus albus]